MAFTIINTTDTLEQMRVKLNNLTTNDFGDPSILAGAGLSATSICSAVVEIAGIAFSAAGWTIRDSSSTIQVIGAGQFLDVLGTSNQINAVVSAPDTLTLSFPDTVTITTQLNVSTISISSGTITSSTGNISFSNENLLTTGTLGAGDTSVTSLNSSGAVSGTTGTFTGAVSGTTGTFSSTLESTSLNLTSGNIVFEGSTADNFETTLTVVDPTADRTITLPNISGTVITTGDTGTVSTTMIANDAITEAKIADDAVGQDQLKTLVTLQILNSSGGILKTIYGAGA